MKLLVVTVVVFVCAWLVLDYYPFGAPFSIRYDSFDYARMAESLYCFPRCAFGFDYVPALARKAAFQTTFPAGFAIAIHVLSRAGLSVLDASFAASAIAYAVSVMLVIAIARRYLRPGYCMVLALLFATSASVLRMGR